MYIVQCPLAVASVCWKLGLNGKFYSQARICGKPTKLELLQIFILGKISPRSIRRHILNLLIVILYGFVSFGFQTGQKPGRETCTGLTPAVGDSLTSRVTCRLFPQQYTKKMYTPSCLGSNWPSFVQTLIFSESDCWLSLQACLCLNLSQCMFNPFF